MRAEEYLYSRQILYKRYDYLVEILQARRSAFTSAAGIKVAQPSSTMPALSVLEELVDGRARDNLANLDYEEGYAKRAHKLFMSNLSDGGRATIGSLDIAVGELETANFNAVSLLVPNTPRAYVLAFNQGLSWLTYIVARLVSATFAVSLGNDPREPTISNEHAAGMLHERLNCYLHTGLPYGPDYAIPSQQMLLASQVTTMAERFIYCHEISHVLLGHLDSPERVQILRDNHTMEATSQSHAEEYEADTLGWFLSLGMIRSGGNLQLAFTGVALFLEIVHLLGCARESLASDSHPPPRDRLARIEDLVTREARTNSQPIETVFAIKKSFIGRFEELASSMPPLPGESPLQRLLDQASVGPVPDYASFQDWLLDLMSHSRPYKLCKALGSAIAETEASFSALGIDLYSDSQQLSPEMIDRSEVRRALNKLKLLVGTVKLYFTSEIQDSIEWHRLNAGGRPRND